MSIYAMIKDNTVINIIVWDGKNLEFDEGISTVKLPNDSMVQIGWAYDGKNFIAPPVPEPTPEELLAKNTAEQQRLMSAATKWINVLTDATDPDIMGDDVDENDVALLKAWKKYRVLLSRVDLTVEEPDWPALPE